MPDFDHRAQPSAAWKGLPANTSPCSAACRQSLGGYRGSFTLGRNETVNVGVEIQLHRGLRSARHSTLLTLMWYAVTLLEIAVIGLDASQPSSL